MARGDGDPPKDARATIQMILQVAAVLVSVAALWMATAAKNDEASARTAERLTIIECRLQIAEGCRP